MVEAPTAQKENEKYGKISAEEKNYNIDLSLENENIIMKIIFTNPTKNEIYENSYSFSNLQINKYFKICDNINEAYILLTDLVNSKEKKVVFNSLNQISLIIPIDNPIVKDVNFQLKSKEKKIDDKILELYYIIENQQKEINFLKNEILKNEKSKKEEEEKIKMKEEEKLKYLQKNSLIIKNEEDKEKAIRDWINPNKQLEFNLIFRMSRDGSNCSDFHRFCDNKGETLLLFKTDKNYRFGAYTPLNWVTPSSGEVNDPKDNLTFLFSLNKMQKFTKIPGQGLNTARSQKDYGPLLGNATDLGINKDMRTGWLGNNTFLRNRELANGESSFNLIEMEIFQVLNNNSK